MLEVRAARHGDAPALDALGAAPEAGVFVLEKNGAVIGALTLRAGEIFGCAVAPEWRGRGYGTFLLRRALRAAFAFLHLRVVVVADAVGPPPGLFGDALEYRLQRQALLLRLVRRFPEKLALVVAPTRAPRACDRLFHAFPSKWSVMLSVIQSMRKR